MFSLRFALVATAALVAHAQAQSTDYPIVPGSVPLNTRKAWCTSETTQCPLICLDTGSSGKPVDNHCDPITLNYGCVCANNISPNLTEYSLTLPYYKCVQYGEDCVKACGLANNDCSEACRKNNPCGASSPKGATTSVASGVSVTASSTSTSVTGAQTGFAGASSSSNTSTGSGASLQLSLTLAGAITGLVLSPFFFL